MINKTPFIKPTLFEFSHLARYLWSMNLGSGAPGERFDALARSQTRTESNRINSLQRRGVFCGVLSCQVLQF